MQKGKQTPHIFFASILENVDINQKVGVVNVVMAISREMASQEFANITDIHTNKQIDVLHSNCQTMLSFKMSANVMLLQSVEYKNARFLEFLAIFTETKQ